jgi:hypothetical protein
VIASQSASWEAVLSSLASAPLPDGATIAYAKHMTHHVLPSVDLAAFAGFRHAFLIRDPRALLASYARVRSAPTLEDLGLRQQVSLYEAFGGPVIDSSDLLADPEAGLRALCAALSVPFSVTMLSWPAGPRDSDGVWGPYWYDSVWRSTGFGRGNTPAAASSDAASSDAASSDAASDATSVPRDPLPSELEPLAEQCLPYYERLAAHKLAF